MKQTLKRIITAALCLLTLCAVFIVPASADNVCKQITGHSRAESTFIVKTKSRWIVKDVLILTQTKGVMNTMKGHYYTAPTFSENKATGTKKMYEKYFVTVEKLNGKNQVVNTRNLIFDESKLKIKLDKNSTYRIKVTPAFYAFAKKMQDRNFYITNRHLNPYGLEYSQGNIITRIFSSITKSNWKPLGWKNKSSWKVSTTRGIGGCEFH